MRLSNASPFVQRSVRRSSEPSPFGENARAAARGLGRSDRGRTTGAEGEPGQSGRDDRGVRGGPRSEERRRPLAPGDPDAAPDRLGRGPGLERAADLEPACSRRPRTGPPVIATMSPRCSWLTTDPAVSGRLRTRERRGLDRREAALVERRPGARQVRHVPTAPVALRVRRPGPEGVGVTVAGRARPRRSPASSTARPATARRPSRPGRRSCGSGSCRGPTSRRRTPRRAGGRPARRSPSRAASCRGGTWRRSPCTARAGCRRSRAPRCRHRAARSG